MAITTSPDNIPSPTSGDPYNYVVDMAALADGTQDALTQKANMGVGTSTQRTAALSKFPNGALWYDTTTSSEWRKVGGAWVNQDTGWVDCDNRAGFTGTVQVRKLGQVVFVAGQITGTFSGGATTSVVDIPAGFRPPGSDHPMPAIFSSGDYNWGRIRGEGVMQVRKTTTGSSTLYIGTSWIGA